MRVEEALEQLRQSSEMLREQYPDLERDDEVWLTSLQSMTDATTLLEYLAERAIFLVALQASALERARELQARARRFENEEERLRDVILAMVEAAGGRKLVLANVTLSPRSTPAKLQEVDASQTPPEYLKTVTTTAPDKKLIKEALDLGAQVDGWAKTNGGRSISLHVR